MSTSFSLLLLAAGAILAFAVDYRVQGIEIQTVGLILLAVGIVGLVISMLFLASFAPFATRERYVERTSTTEHHTHDDATRDHA